MKKYNSKVDHWLEFSHEVLKHINEYVLPQYGDFPDDHINGLTVEEIRGKMSSYVRRIGKVQIHRGVEGAKVDLYKLAHFCAYLIDKL